MKRNIIHTHRQAGFTLLMAALIASFLLIWAASMFNLVSKSIVLSSLGRDSQFAFYAADTGAECALFWDFRHSAFSQSSGYTGATCDGQSLGTIIFPGIGTPMEFEFEPNGFCARVSVVKAATFPNTTIEARGYSTTCERIAIDPRALERAVVLTY